MEIEGGMMSEAGALSTLRHRGGEASRTAAASLRAQSEKVLEGAEQSVGHSQGLKENRLYETQNDRATEQRSTTEMSMNPNSSTYAGNSPASEAEQQESQYSKVSMVIEVAPAGQICRYGIE